MSDESKVAATGSNPEQKPAKKKADVQLVAIAVSVAMILFAAGYAAYSYGKHHNTENTRLKIAIISPSDFIDTSKPEEIGAQMSRMDKAATDLAKQGYIALDARSVMKAPERYFVVPSK